MLRATAERQQRRAAIRGEQPRRAFAAALAGAAASALVLFGLACSSPAPDTATGPAGTTARSAATSTRPPSSVGTEAFVERPVFSPGGSALAVFLGGSVADLAAATSAVGARGAWAQDTSGAFRLYAVGAPAFANAVFETAFPGGMRGPTALTLIR